MGQERRRWWQLCGAVFGERARGGGGGGGGSGIREMGEGGWVEGVAPSANPHTVLSTTAAGCPGWCSVLTAARVESRT